MSCSRINSACGLTSDCDMGRSMYKSLGHHEKIEEKERISNVNKEKPTILGNYHTAPHV